jgi:hypothetical protein
MLVRSLASGLRATATHPRLAVLLWLWSAVLTLPIAAPLWSLLYGATAFTPRADGLLAGPNLADLAEITRYDATSIWGLAASAFWAVAALAVLSQALVAGGTLEVLLSNDVRSFPHRFFRGAGHFFWRFLRAGVTALLAALLSMALAAAMFAPLSRLAADSSWEPAWYLVQLARVAALGVVVWFWLLALDYARIRLAVESRWSAVFAMGSAAGLVLRRVPTTFGIWIAGGVGLAGLAALYGAFRSSWPADTMIGIAAMFVVQQLIVLGRAFVRLGVIGAELHAYRQLTAPPPAPAVSQPPTDLDLRPASW